MVYLHIPFCRSFCTYCAFYSELFQQSTAQDYTQAVLRELSLRKAEIEQTLDLNTLYIGGGTPSVLPPVFLSQIVSELREITGGNYAEFTVELNPDDVTPDYVAFLKSMGVTRVSMGVQSFDDALLARIARRHNSEAVRRAYSLLREGGFDNISLDLIFGFGHWADASAADGTVGSDGFETFATQRLERDLDAILSLPGGPPEHISAYQLSIEEGSALEKQCQKGRYVEADEDFCEQSYLRICERLSRVGYEHYEISNFARPGYRAQHNSAYWSGCPYVGIGPAAHSYDGKVRSWNSSDVQAYCAAYTADVSSADTAFRESEWIDEEKRRLEHLFLSLRTAEGVEEAFLKSSVPSAKLEDLLSRGCLEKSQKIGNLRFPEHKWFVSDSLISELV